MDLARVKPVGQHQTVETIFDRVDPNPSAESERLELARNMDPHAVARPLELDRPLAGPAAVDPIAPDDRPIHQPIAAPVDQRPAAGVSIGFEGKVGDHPGIVGNDRERESQSLYRLCLVKAETLQFRLPQE